MSPASGDPVRVVMTKWGGQPHWEYGGILLGSDGAGDWIGLAAGTYMSRPGAEYVAPVDQVVLVPAPGESEDRGWLATFHAHGGQVHTYVDMTTPPYWEDSVLHAVDLDLDVVRGTNGRVWLDDEDEFARHRRELGYPQDVVALAVSTAERIQASVSAAEAPFDATADTWLSIVSDRCQ